MYVNESLSVLVEYKHSCTVIVLWRWFSLVCSACGVVVLSLCGGVWLGAVGDGGFVPHVNA